MSEGHHNTTDHELSPLEGFTKPGRLGMYFKSGKENNTVKRARQHREQVPRTLGTVERSIPKEQIEIVTHVDSATLRVARPIRHASAKICLQSTYILAL